MSKWQRFWMYQDKETKETLWSNQNHPPNENCTFLHSVIDCRALDDLKTDYKKLREALLGRRHIIAITDDDREPAAMGNNVFIDIAALEEVNDEEICEALTSTKDWE